MAELPPVLVTLIILAGSVFAGLMGSLLGLGGGIIVVPLLTMVHYTDVKDMHYVVGASIVAVIATSSGGAASYLRDRIANLRVGMFLEIASVSGALAGALLAGVVPGAALSIAFGGVMVYAAIMMWRQSRRPLGTVHLAPDPLADRLKMHGSYYDPAEKRQVSYHVRGTGAGLAASGVAGVVSGLLGVGGGIMKVPAMHMLMHLPMKASTATSNFMIGVTAAAGATVYLVRGEVDPYIAGPVAVGVLMGSYLGTRVFGRIRSATLIKLFVVIVVITAVRMVWKGIEGLSS
jgi:uncharacterized membrane protein YfcA